MKLIHWLVSRRAGDPVGVYIVMGLLAILAALVIIACKLH